MSRNLTPRKKLAVPPVKSACLAWYCSLFSLSSGTCALLTGCSRASRTRCDGGQTCHNVSSKRCKVARARAEPALPPSSVWFETGNVAISLANGVARGRRERPEPIAISCLRNGACFRPQDLLQAMVCHLGAAIVSNTANISEQ